MATSDTTETKPRTRRGHDVSGEKRDGDGRFAKTATPRKRAPKSGNGGEGWSVSNPFASEAGQLWGAAAAGVAVGVAAMIGRKVIVQAPTLLAGDWDEALATEHAAVSKVFDAIEATTTKNTTKRTMLLAQLKHALAKHAMQEENVVYPALRDAGQTEAADHLNKDHGYVKQYLYELENCPKDSMEFLSIVGKFRAALDEHVREEEDELFPSLKSQLSVESNKKLTAMMNKEGFKLA